MTITPRFFFVILLLGCMSFGCNDAHAGSDPEVAKQKYLTVHNIYEAQAQIKGKGKKVIVAVIEKGFDVTHSDIVGNLWINKNRLTKNNNYKEENKKRQDQGLYVEEKYGASFGLIDYSINNLHHGTVVMGTIGAGIDNDIGIRGIVKNIQIMPLMVSNTRGTVGVKMAIIYAVDAGANIINISMGSQNIKQSEILPAINYATQKGVIVVASMGNEGLDTSKTLIDGVCSEVTKEQIIGVGSIDFEGNQSSWSNYGTCLDVWAMGENIYTTSTGDSYGFVFGTSLSSPIVAGIVGLGFNKHGKKSIKKIYNALQKSSINGIIDAKKYIEYIGKK